MSPPRTDYTYSAAGLRQWVENTPVPSGVKIQVGFSHHLFVLPSHSVTLHWKRMLHFGYGNSSGVTLTGMMINLAYHFNHQASRMSEVLNATKWVLLSEDSINLGLLGSMIHKQNEATQETRDWWLELHQYDMTIADKPAISIDWCYAVNVLTHVDARTSPYSPFQKAVVIENAETQTIRPLRLHRGNTDLVNHY